MKSSYIVFWYILFFFRPAIARINLWNFVCESASVCPFAWNSTRPEWNGREWIDLLFHSRFHQHISCAHTPQNFLHRLFCGRLAMVEESWAWVIVHVRRSPPFHQEFKTKRQTPLFSLEKHYRQQPWMLRFHITRTHIKFLYVNSHITWIQSALAFPTKGDVFFLIIYALA